MLLVNYLRNNTEEAKTRLSKRGMKEEALSVIDDVIAKDDQRKKLQFENDSLLSEMKKVSDAIGALYKSGNREEAEAKKAEVAVLKEKSNALQEEQKSAEKEIYEALLNIPNAPHMSVPSGVTEDDNEVFKAFEGNLPVLPDDAKAHWDIAEEYDIIDFPLGVKITGSGFPVFKGKGARLQRGLINFFLDQAIEAGYQEIIPPLVVNEDSARGTGQLPDKEGQMYHIQKDELFLIPTAEVPLTNIYRDVILAEEDFPIKLTGHTPCFRREAGAYGKDVRGLNRVHQFDKIEIVQVQHPDKSYDTLMDMLSHVEALLEKLELPYRILKLCGGDLGSTSAMTYDFEVWSVKLRYRGEDKKTHLAHTLNGSALALARIVAALLENNQTSDGIRMPKALVPYLGFDLLT